MKAGRRLLISVMTMILILSNIGITAIADENDQVSASAASLSYVLEDAQMSDEDNEEDGFEADRIGTAAVYEGSDTDGDGSLEPDTDGYDDSGENRGEMGEEPVTLEHIWNTEYTVDQEATCTEEGIESIHCIDCGEVQEGSARSIPRKEHSYGAWVITKEAGCKESGIREKVCEGCGDVVTEEIPAAGHDFGEWETVVQSTYDHAGRRERTCIHCGEVLQEAIDALARISLADSSVTGISALTYTGAALKPSPIVKIGADTLRADKDYTVSYKNNTNAGTATVTLTGRGGYTGSKTVTFKIDKAGQNIAAKSSATSIAVGKTAAVSITGSKGKKSFKSSNTAVATVNADGKVTAKKVGTVKITANSAATANYKAASKVITIKVVPAATSSIKAANQATGIKLTWKKVTGATGYKVYRGSTLIKSIKSGATVTFTDTKANSNGAKYTFKIIPTSSVGNGTAKSLTTYRLTRSSISSLKSGAAQKMTAGWSKNAKAKGYRIQYSTNSGFKSGNKSVTISNAATVSRTISGLTGGKNYYVRIRAYKSVSGKNYYSAWSAAKKVYVKKSAVTKAAPSTPSGGSYIGNRNSKIFHHSWCSSVKKMKDSNKVGFGSRSDAVGKGYRPCKICNP